MTTLPVNKQNYSLLLNKEYEQKTQHVESRNLALHDKIPFQTKENSTLLDETRIKQFTKLAPNDLRPISKKTVEKYLGTSISVLNKSLNTRVESSVPKIAFGKSEWQKYFGDIGTEPPLPSDIEEILNSQDPFWPNETVKKSQMLVLIPQAVNGKFYTLNLMEELIQQPKTGPKTKYRYSSDYIKNELGNKRVPNSYWVLKTRKIIPGSLNLPFKNQINLIKSYNQKIEPSYVLPTALEAATSILVEHVRNGNRLYNDEPLESITYTRCKEIVNETYRVTIGGFSELGLELSSCGGGCGGDSEGDYSTGVACLRKFGVSN